MRPGLALVVFPLVSFGHAQDPIRDVLVGSKEAFLLEEPQLVAGPTILQTKWSTDGQWLALVQQPSRSKSKLQILAWNTAKKSLTTLWSFNPTTTKVDRLTWLPRSSSLVVVSHQTQHEEAKNVLLLRPQANPVVLYEGDAAAISIVTTETRATGSILASSSSKTQWTVFGPNGSMGPVADVTVPGGTTMLSTAFARSGEGPYVLTMTGTGDSLQPAKTLRYDPSGRTFVVPRPDDIDEFPTIEELQNMLLVSTEPLPVPPTVRRGRSTVVLRQGTGKLVVTTDGMSPEISKNGASIVYLHLGAAIVRPVSRMSLNDYRSKEGEALRVQAFEDATRIAEGIGKGLGVGNGYPNKTMWRPMLRAFINDDGVLDGLTYVYDGPTRIEKQDLPTTILGFVAAGSGKAVITADLLVKWMPNG